MKPKLTSFKVVKDFTRKLLYGKTPTGKEIYLITHHKVGEVLCSYTNSKSIKQLLYEEKITYPIEEMA